ncbi:MAG: Zn-dependent hydrolase [Bacteroidota bacterium]
MKLLPTLLLGATLLLATVLFGGCQVERTDSGDSTPDSDALVVNGMTIDERLAQYTPVRLTADLDHLTDNQREVVRLLIQAGEAMDEVFWQQAYGDRDALMAALDTLPQGEAFKRFAAINYGPYDRLNGNEAFAPGFDAKPAGAQFYPADLTTAQFDAAVGENPALASLYTLVRRADDGTLTAVPYHEAFADAHARAADLLAEAAPLAENEGFQRYLTLRAQALRTDDYQPSDLAWMDLADNDLDVVIGPIETYEDQLNGFKAAHSAYVLLKDRAWSARLARYAELLPGLQEGLPVPDAYKQDPVGSDADLGAYDVLYYAGDSNAGSKTIAINLPNDEEVQQQKGSRRLQLKNAMRAKFDEILVPIAGELIDAEQRANVTFDAFFANTMFHEVAHGLGIKNTLDGAGTVRESLRDQASALEEGKADVLGLYMITQLAAQGEYDTVLEENFTTFVASVFRSIRFGSASAHGRANLLRFNYFVENGAIERQDDGTYRVDYDAITDVSNALSERILTFQGDGDYEGVVSFVEEYGQVGDQLQADLDRLSAVGIPVDVTFEQGPSVLGL